MDELSVIWSTVIILITLGEYLAFSSFVSSSRAKMPLACICLSTLIYSGLGIAYQSVKKANILYYTSFLFVVCLTYIVVVKPNRRVVLSSKHAYEFRCVDDQSFWGNDYTKKVFKALAIVYMILRLVGLLYPINRLANFTLIFNSVNNINNITGANASFLSTICAWLSPFFYVGLFYWCRRVSTVGIILGFDLLITLIKTGYLSRYTIVVVIIICLLLYFHGDLNQEYISLSRKWKRIITSLAIVIPVLIYVLIAMMESRLTSGANFTLSSLIKSEIGYPLQYEDIHRMAPISNPGDFFLQLIDSFVPLLPTPSYHMDLNVDFSTMVLGYGVETGWFSIKLPSVLGESMLIFGNSLFWLHGVIIGFLTAFVYKVTRENKQMIILYYYYLTCILTTGRAGYEQLSQSVWLNYVVFIVGINVIRLMCDKKGMTVY